MSLALTGDAAVSMLAVLAIPIVTLGARFPVRGILIGVAPGGHDAVCDEAS